MLVPLNVHSYYSLMGGLDSPLNLCKEIKKLGYRSFALTDTNGLYGMVRFIEAADEVGIHPLIGTEIVFSSPYYRFMIYVMNERGYQGLCCFLSHFHQQQNILQHFLQSPRNTLGDDLLSGCIISSDCHEIIEKLRGIVPYGQLYYELSPGFYRLNDLDRIKAWKIPLLATNRVHYINPTDSFYYRLMRAIAENKTLSQVKDIYGHNDYCYLMGPKQLEKFYYHCPEALKNTFLIEERCHKFVSMWKNRKFIFPKFQNLNEQGAFERLKSKCEQNICGRWPRESDEFYRKVKERINYELKIIRLKGFSSYFLVVADIVEQSRRTCGRGSAAASVISYLLGLTHVDPIKHNLFFDRFLNPEREDPPDIDIDFPWDERDAVLDYVFRTYPECCAMVANHNCFQGRMALREVAKVYGMAADEISYVVDRFPKIKLSASWQKILQIASRFQDQVRYLSVHCGGVVITPKLISSYVPVEISSKGLPVIQWEKDQAEEAGLIKIDLLGNRSLAVIRDTIDMVNRNYNKNLSYETLDPLNDQETGELLKRGDTTGVFYIESPATRLMLTKMKTKEFENIVIASSIIRPAANKFSNEFIRRLHGGKYRYLHPLLKDILEESLGIMVYQEQVTKVAMALADFSSYEGNDLRKVLGKKHKETKLADYKERFYHKAMLKGVGVEVLNEIWSQIMSFSGYSFCKPHSASYALVSYKSCYLKAHYPSEFMASVISNGGGYYGQMTYLEEARKMNIKILPPDINYSLLGYRGRDRMIRVGLMQVKHLTLKTCQRIIEQRLEKGKYIDLNDFINRVVPSFSEAKILVKSRCFQSIKKTEQSYLTMMWEVYYHWSKKSPAIKRLVQGQEQNSLLKIGPSPAIADGKRQEYQSDKLVRWEKIYLQGSVSFPDWAIYQDALKIRGRVRSDELKNYKGKNVLLFGQKVTSKRVWTKNKEAMCFVSFSDEAAIFETVFFPGVFATFQDLLVLEGAYLIWGKVQEDRDAIQVEVHKLESLPNPYEIRQIALT